MEGNQTAKKYQVFISSTFDGLQELRKELVWSLLGSRRIPAGMEFFPSTNEQSINEIKGQIDESDFFVLIIANRYGSIPNGYFNGKKIGFVEREYNYAKSKRKPIFAFILKDNTENTNQLGFRKKDNDDEKEKRLASFKKKVEKGRNVKYFENPDQLLQSVQNAISNAIEKKQKRRLHIGWERIQDTPDNFNWTLFYETANEVFKNIVKEECIGGFDFDAVVGVSHGGLAVADMFVHDYTRNMPAFPLFAYKIDGEPYFDAEACIAYNENTIAMMKKGKYRKILVFDSLSRSGRTIQKARDFIQNKMGDVVIKTAVIYVNKTIPKEKIEELSYYGKILRFDNRNLTTKE